MKSLNKETRQQIIDLKKKGYSSRWIANHVGCGKSTVNDVYNAYLSASNSPVRGTSPKILFLDVETTADIVATFGRRNVNISESNVIQQGNELISVALSWLDSDNVVSYSARFNGFSINEDLERDMLDVIRSCIESADAVVIHNARFDLGTIQQRMLHYGMGRLPSVKVIDTLQIARKYLQLRSNKLDSITKYFGLSNKVENEGIGLWIKVQAGCEQALQRMVQYNEGDVIALKDVYRKFVSLNLGVNTAIFSDHEGHVCTSCGSHSVSKTGQLVHTSVSSFEEFECNDCGAKMRGRVNVLPKEKRKNLLVPI